MKTPLWLNNDAMKFYVWKIWRKKMVAKIWKIFALTKNLFFQNILLGFVISFLHEMLQIACFNHDPLPSGNFLNFLQVSKGKITWLLFYELHITEKEITMIFFYINSGNNAKIPSGMVQSKLQDDNCLKCQWMSQLIYI